MGLLDRIFKKNDHTDGSILSRNNEEKNGDPHMQAESEFYRVCDNEYYNAKNGKKVDFKRIINEVIKLLRTYGYDEPGIKEIIENINKSIQRGTNDVANISGIRINLAGKLNVIKSAKASLEEELKRIEREYPPEEQEFYKTYAIESAKTPAAIDFEKIMETMREHLTVVGYGETEVNDFISSAEEEFNKAKDDPKRSNPLPYFVALNLKPKIDAIKRAKESLEKELARIESMRKLENLPEEYRQFNYIYGDVNNTYFGDVNHTYLNKIIDNLIGKEKAKFEIDFGHDEKKDDLIKHAYRLLQLLGCGSVGEGRGSLMDIGLEFSKAKKKNGSDFTRAVSDILMQNETRMKTRIADYTDKPIFDLLARVSVELFGFPQGEEGTKEYIRLLMMSTDSKLDEEYNMIDRYIVPPDRSAEIVNEYRREISRLEQIKPIDIEDKFKIEEEIAELKGECLIAQLKSNMEHSSKMGIREMINHSRMVRYVKNNHKISVEKAVKNALTEGTTPTDCRDAERAYNNENTHMQGGERSNHE